MWLVMTDQLNSLKLSQLKKNKKTYQNFVNLKCYTKSQYKIIFPHLSLQLSSWQIRMLDWRPEPKP